MSSAKVRRLITRALVSAVIFVAQNIAFTQVNSEPQQREQLGQFCAPPDEHEAPRLYCQDWRGQPRGFAMNADALITLQRALIRTSAAG
jgi:hypothetical protein